MATFFEAYLTPTYLNSNHFSLIFNWTNSNPIKSKTRKSLITAPEELERSPDSFPFSLENYIHTILVSIFVYICPKFLLL